AYEPRPWVKVVRLGSPASFPGGASVVAGPPDKPVRRSLLRRLAPRALGLWTGFARETRRLARLIREHPVELFHTQNTGCEESPPAAKLAAVRHVLGTFHVDSTYDLHRLRSGLPHRLLERLSNHSLDKAIGVSAATAEDWIRRTHLPRHRAVTVH